jgi:hypothetical protein
VQVSWRLQPPCSYRKAQFGREIVDSDYIETLVGALEQLGQKCQVLSCGSRRYSTRPPFGSANFRRRIKHTPFSADRLRVQNHCRVNTRYTLHKAERTLVFSVFSD